MRQEGAMRQLLVECSDPGVVVTLEQEFENVLREIDFDRARAIGHMLSELSRELGPGIDRTWAGFRLEVPNDGGRPLSFGNRDVVDEDSLQRLLAAAGERGIGRFAVRRTQLLPQDGPMPETRRQYVRDLADGVEFWAPFEESGGPRILRFPIELPDTIAAYRAKIVDEYAVGVLRDRAIIPAAGERWITESVDRLRKALREVNTRAEAVMEYELARLDPVEMEARERLRWLALAVRLGTGFERWYAPAEDALSYIYQKAALARLMWNDSKGFGPVRPFLEGRLAACIDRAAGVYTGDGVDALRLMRDDLCGTGSVLGDRIGGVGAAEAGPPEAKEE
jgi:hypothetical protein